MHRNRKLAYILALCIGTNVAAAEDRCFRLIQQGLYNHFRSSRGNEDMEVARKNSCSAYRQESRRRDALDTSGSAYFQMFTGNLSGSHEDDQATFQALCTKEFTSSSVKGHEDVYSSVVDREVVAAWSKCVGLAETGGLHLDVNELKDNPNAISIAMYYSPGPGIAAAQMITAITIKSADDQQTVRCEGPLEKQVGKVLGPRNLSMLCTRSAPKAGLKYMDEDVYAAPATVAVETTVHTVVLNFPKVPKFPRPPLLTERILKGEPFVVVFDAKDSGAFADKPPKTALGENPLDPGWRRVGHLEYSTSVAGQYLPEKKAWSSGGAFGQAVAPNPIYTSFRCGGNERAEDPCADKGTPAEHRLIVFGVSFEFNDEGGLFFTPLGESTPRRVGYVSVRPFEPKKT
jgi:hypothetical protein